MSMSELLDLCLEPDGLFVSAFQPLKDSLDKHTQKLHNQTPTAYSPWLEHAGKGGDKVDYIDFYDQSLYGHCMDVAVIAFMLFIHSWEAKKFPHPTEARQFLPPLSERPEQQAEIIELATACVRKLLVLAFSHDADKYCQRGTSGAPQLDEVKTLFDDLNIKDWEPELTPETVWTLILPVEERGEPLAITATLIQQEEGNDIPKHLQTLSNFVRAGDKLCSRGAVDGGSFAQLIEVYNQHFLTSFHLSWGVPNQPLKLLTFRYDPVVLFELQKAFQTSFYQNAVFPLVMQIKGHQFFVSVPEHYDLKSVFSDLLNTLSDVKTDLKRNATNGEITLFGINDAEALVELITEKLEFRALAIHSDDWAQTETYVKAWAADAGADHHAKAETGKLLLAITSTNISDKLKYALSIAVALRAGAKGKLFEQRLQRLKSLLTSSDAFASLDESTLKKDTLQTLYAMQAAVQLEDDEQLNEWITSIYGDFSSEGAADEGAAEIVNQLKLQCGLGQVKAQRSSYQANTKGGTCLLCGTPTDNQIESGKMKLAGVKSSAFNNRIGHRKNIWSQSEKNYLCPACVKTQALLCDAQPKLRAVPATIAIPFRGLIKSPSVAEGTDMSLIRSFDAVSKKDWMKVLPWHLDTSAVFPFILEEPAEKFDEVLDAMYRYALLALLTGQSVQVFTAFQRQAIKASFLFEKIPPLISKLTADLSLNQMSEEKAQTLAHLKSRKHKHYGTAYDAIQAQLANEIATVRRGQKLVELVKRLSLLRQIASCGAGHETLSAMPAFGWWAVAWLNSREEFAKNYLVWQSKLLFEQEQNFAMNKYDDKISEIAELAKRIQKPLATKASASERNFALYTALNEFEKSLNYPANVKGAIPAAMSGMVAESLNRRKLAAAAHNGIREDADFYKACGEFAHKVYDLVVELKQQHLYDARFKRFLIAAYGYLFITTNTKD